MLSVLGFDLNDHFLISLLSKWVFNVKNTGFVWQEHKLSLRINGNAQSLYLNNAERLILLKIFMRTSASYVDINRSIAVTLL
jgi:hypothetical protein